MKQILANPFVQLVIGCAIGLYMHLVALTTRWRMEGRASAEQVWAGGQPTVGAIWHGRFFLIHRLWNFRAPQKPWMLISQSREGGIVTHASRTVGADVVRGSAAKVSKDGSKKDKGGFEALREMLRLIRTPGFVVLTPDGPRGPRMRAQLGPLTLAKLSGAPILPMAWSTRWGRRFNSWDRFVLPAPFGPGALVWGELIHVPRDADAAALEIIRAKLEAELNRVTARADELAGAPSVTPAPVPAEPAAQTP